MKKKFVIICAALFFMGTSMIAQNAVIKSVETVKTVVEETKEQKEPNNGKIKSLGNRVASIEKRIEMARAKLDEHEKKGTMSKDAIAKKRAQIDELETKVVAQKEELASVANTPKPNKPNLEDMKGKGKQGKGKGHEKGKGHSKAKEVKGKSDNVDSRPILVDPRGSEDVKSVDPNTVTKPGKENVTKGNNPKEIKKEIKVTGKDKAKEVIEKGNDKAKDALDKGKGKSMGKGKGKDHK